MRGSCFSKQNETISPGALFSPPPFGKLLFSLDNVVIDVTLQSGSLFKLEGRESAKVFRVL